MSPSLMKENAAIILAAGQGKRMKSALPKVLHAVAGVPMIAYVIDMVERLAFGRRIVIVGHQSEQVKTALAAREVTLLLQDPPSGTGHAVLQARETLLGFSGAVFILSGDTPLLRDETLQQMWALHQKEAATITLLTAKLTQPTGYGRVIRNTDQTIQRIVEERDASETERQIREINCGVYIAQAAFLFEALQKITPNNRQKEYYLTDMIGVASDQGMKMVGVEALPEEAMGINSRADLAMADRVIRARINAFWMAEGVTLLHPDSTRIDASVKVGRDTLLYPNVTLEGKTEIGEGCTLYPCRIKNSRLESGIVVKDHCVIEEAQIESGATVGPFAHLRPGTLLRKGAKVGNFVEIKKAEIGEGSKANHLSYIGDAVIGRRVNIGAGTITCNYDGEKKYQTIIEDDVFVGSDTQFVAPVRVGARSLIAAGSTITEDVPQDTLALSRMKQENKIGWMEKKRKKQKKTE